MDDWRVLDAFPQYEVSAQGQVRNAKTKRILKPAVCKGKHPYHVVQLSHKGKGNMRRVHRLVAMAWLGDWNPELSVDHINRITTDNRLENLRMATPSEQSQNRVVANGFKGRRIPVDQFTLEGKFVKCHESIGAAAIAVGKHPANLSRAISQGRAHAGSLWKYTTSPEIEGEVWKHFKGAAYLSSEGRFKLRMRNGQFGIAKFPNELWQDQGYPRFEVEGKKWSLHIAIATLFLGPSTDPAKNTVNHIDGNTFNAAVRNLEWCTRAENSQHAHDTGLMRIKRAVQQIDGDGNVIATFESIKKAVSETGVSHVTIRKHATGKHGKQAVPKFVWLSM